MIARFIRDGQGQDLIEYARLGSFASLAAYAGATAISTAMNTTYASWDAAGQSSGLVEVPEP